MISHIDFYCFQIVKKTSFSGFLLTKFPQRILIILIKFPGSTKKILKLVAQNVERCLSYLPSYFFNSQIWLYPLMEDCHFSYITKLWKTNTNVVMGVVKD